MKSSLKNSLLGAAVFAATSGFSLAAPITWNNTGTDFNAADGWGGETTPAPGAGDTAVFTGAAVTSPVLSVPATVQALNFSDTAASGYTISGSPLTLTSEGTGTGSAYYSLNAFNSANTISSNLVLGQTAGATASFLLPRYSNAYTSNSDLVISGNISSNNSIAGLLLSSNTSPQQYGALFTLSGTNTYSGDTTLSAASLNIGSAGAISTGSLILGTNPVVVNNTTGAPLALSNDLKIGSSYSFFGGDSLTFNGASSLTGNILHKVLIVSDRLQLGSLDYGGSELELSKNGTITLSGPGTGGGLANTLGGVSYSITLRRYNGALEIGNATAFGTGALHLSLGSVVRATSALAGPVNNTIVSDSTSIAIDGTNNLDLGGNFICNNFGTGTTLTVTNTGATKLSGTVSLSDSSIDSAAGLIVSVANTSGATEISGKIQNSTVGGGTTAGTFSKTGTGILVLSGDSTYTGATTVSGGSLLVNGSLGDTAVSVANKAKLGGTGSIGGNTTIQSGGKYSAGELGAVGTQTFAKNLSLAPGSIFEWDLAAESEDSGFDKVVGASGQTFDSAGAFRVITGLSFGTTFWDEEHTWKSIVTGFGNLTGWAANTPVTVYDSNGTIRSTSGQGAFTVSGTKLTWSAVPETSNLLAGILLAAGLLRRRRK